MESNQLIIVLVETQMGENIGMCARAMLNCGLQKMRLVRPRDGWPSEKAVACSADADCVIEEAVCFDSVEEAVADCHRVYATTARARNREIPTLAVQDAVKEMHGANEVGDAGQRVAILFGPEASGLDNEALALADRLVQFPMNPSFSSLNLAQAVLLFSWEWWSKSEVAASLDQEEGTMNDPAEKAKVVYFMERLEKELDQSGFFLTPDMRPRTVANLRAFFGRATPSEQELNLLHGMLTALIKNPSND